MRVSYVSYREGSVYVWHSYGGSGPLARSTYHRHSIDRVVSTALHSIAAAGGSTVGVRLRSEGSDNVCVIPMVDACMYTRAVFSQPSL